MSEPKLGSKVQESEDSVTWRVVGIDDQKISLSGPGPCRGMRVVSREEFEESWQEVN